MQTARYTSAALASLIPQVAFMPGAAQELTDMVMTVQAVKGNRVNVKFISAGYVQYRTVSARDLVIA